MKRKENYNFKLKALILTIISIIIFFSQNYAQLPKDENNKIVFEDVVQQENFTQKAIYDKAKLWIVTTLKSGDNMIELGGDESQNITGTGNIILSNQEYSAGGSQYEMQNVSLNFKFSIFCKEGRFKYRVENFTLRYNADVGLYSNEFRSALEEPKIAELESEKRAKKRDEVTQLIYKDVDHNINSLIASLKNFMNSKEEEW